MEFIVLPENMAEINIMKIKHLIALFCRQLIPYRKMSVFIRIKAKVFIPRVEPNTFVPKSIIGKKIACNSRKL